MRSPFRDRLAQPTPLLCDGGMGTQLYARGIPYERCFDELNSSEPATVQAVHMAYIQAGADLIETNTFAANRAQLARFGIERAVRDINLRGVRIAREAKEVCGRDVFLAGSVSSVGQPLEPVGTLSVADARAIFVEQIEALLEGGVDLLVLETFGSLAELRTAVQAARAVSRDLPIVASLSMLADAFAVPPATLADDFAELQSLDIDALGVNCGGGPRETLDALAGLSSVVSCPLIVMPNAGHPTLSGGRHHYVATPAYFADYAGRFMGVGARLIGGCCGTTPEHIAAMREFFSHATPASQADVAPRVTTPLTVVAAPDSDHKTPESPLARKVRKGTFIISVEVDPPRGLQPTKMLEGARSIKAAGADCVDIGDSPMARVRMNCIAFGALVEQRVGLETLIHFTTRDRNAMALQSDLLGAHALGIRNIIALTGDPPRMGNYPAATGVWDVDSIGFIKIIKQLNQGLDWAGNSIGRPTSFLVACAVNPMAADLELEIDRYWRKVEAGADFAITQPLYDLDQLQTFFARVPSPPIPTVLEIMPLQSYKHAEFCHNELAGVVIPDCLLRDMRAAGDRALDVGLRQAHDFLDAAARLVQGVLLVPSFHRYELVNELVRAACDLRSVSNKVAEARA
jgi:methionine synthase / methylenetetrahydrofolate reductase(NADPH)